jgi:hypothetical protein
MSVPIIPKKQAQKSLRIPNYWPPRDQYLKALESIGRGTPLQITKPKHLKHSLRKIAFTLLRHPGLTRHEVMQKTGLYDKTVYPVLKYMVQNKLVVGTPGRFPKYTVNENLCIINIYHQFHHREIQKEIKAANESRDVFFSCLGELGKVGTLYFTEDAFSDLKVHIAFPDAPMTGITRPDRPIQYYRYLTVSQLLQVDATLFYRHFPELSWWIIMEGYCDKCVHLFDNRLVTTYKRGVPERPLQNVLFIRPEILEDGFLKCPDCGEKKLRREEKEARKKYVADRRKCALRDYDVPLWYSETYGEDIGPMRLFRPPGSEDETDGV